MVSLYTANFHGFPEMADIHRTGNASSATVDGPADLLSLVTIIGSSMSLVGLVFGFLVHSLFSDVRSVAATGLMNLLATLFVAQVLFIALVEKARSSTAGVCLGLAFSLRFFWLAVFCWSTALAHNLYRSLKTNETSTGTCNTITTTSPVSPEPAPVTSAGAQEAYNVAPVSKRPLVATVLMYSAVAWGTPLILVLVAAIFVASNYKETSSAVARHHSQFKSFKDCWLAGSIPIHVTFDVPVLFLTVVNIYYFTRIGAAIRYVSSMHIDRKSQKRTSKRHFRQLFLHVKLFTLQVIVWVLEVSAGLSGNHIAWLMFVVGFSLQGGLIALVYACNVKVMKIYLNALARPHRRKSNRRKGSMAVSHSASLELLKAEQWPEAL